MLAVFVNMLIFNPIILEFLIVIILLVAVFVLLSRLPAIFCPCHRILTRMEHDYFEQLEEQQDREEARVARQQERLSYLPARAKRHFTPWIIVLVCLGVIEYLLFAYDPFESCPECFTSVERQYKLW